MGSYQNGYLEGLIGLMCNGAIVLQWVRPRVRFKVVTGLPRPWAPCQEAHIFYSGEG
jgi:hypothetical protein